MYLTERVAGEEKIVYVEGDVDALNVKDFEERINATIPAEPIQLVLDLGALRYISVAGFKVLLRVCQKTTERGKTVRFRNVPQHIMELFRLIGFDKLLLFE